MGAHVRVVWRAHALMSRLIVTCTARKAATASGEGPAAWAHNHTIMPAAESSARAAAPASRTAAPAGRGRAMPPGERTHGVEALDACGQAAVQAH